MVVQYRLEGEAPEAGPYWFTPTLEEDLPTLTANNAYDMPSVKSLVRFLHAAAIFPVKLTWLAAIRSGKYATWPGLTYKNAKAYHPTTAETLKGHMTQTHQGVCSTKCKATPSHPTREVSPISRDISATKSNKLFVVVDPVSKLYTGDMVRFPVRYLSGHLYIMLAFHCYSNAILIEPFQYCQDPHIIAAYSRIMKLLRERGHVVDLQVLDNEASK